ncbi:non-ribosomal peptide synthetase [Candidatus Entotheonella serta]|nr:non-ribosomal peptide synthetase [Candidatus Entotheonella serta]
MSTGATVESQAPDGSQLSPQQRRLWSLQQDGTIHLAGCAIALDGPVQRDLVKAALHILTQRYEILRTSFHCPAGMTLPLQLIRPSSERHHNAAFFWSEDYVEKLDLDMFLARTAFDLETGPFFHAHLTRRSDNDHLLFLAMPALYADDTALALLAREVATLYQVLAFGGSSHADETGDDTPLPYVDVAEWLNDILQSEASESAKLFWQQTAFETGLHLRIPFKHTAVNDTAFRAVTLVRTLAIDHVARLRQMAQTHRITVSAIVLSCWQVLLARLSGQTDVTVAVGYGGRNYEELEDIPGLFTRYLPIAARIEDTLRFDALLQHTRDDLEEADQKQEYYEWEEGPTAGGLYFPFAFDYNTPSNSPYQAGPVTLSMVQTCADTDRFGIRLSCSASERELVLSFRNNTAQFPAEHVGILAEQFLALLDQALAQPDRSVYDLDFLNDIEQQRLLVDFNHLHNEHLNDEVLSETIRCFHHRFEAQVVCTPEAIAAISGSHHLSYRVLNARANILAHHLRQRGVGAEISVGVYLDRSVELLIGLLGILKAGAAYVPLDLTWPLPRLAYVLRDSGMPLVLTRTSLAATLPEDSPPSLCLDDLSWEASPHAALNPSHTVLATNLAYVMYTSGSTGQTKGVRIEHRALTNYLDWALGSYHVTRGRGAPVHASIGFDATITALFLPLLAGQTVHLLPERNEAGDEVEALAAMFATQSGFSLVKLTPAHMDLLQMLLSPDDVAGKANALVIGGEALLEKHLSWWREHAPGMRLINEYGPTETVVGCCFYDVPTDASYQGAIPIGFPLARTQIYILNAQMRPVPRGVAGELHIGGAGLGRDYLHQSALTAEKFVPHPFASEPGARLYRSGDLARHLPNGSAEPGPLEFLGRVDHQVQLRGFRIELGEIEAVLSTHTEVAEQVVLLHQDATGEPRLVAYVQTIQRDPQPHDALRHFLADRLPAYMVPTAFVFVDAFALTPNGKVDRRALPSPDLHGETATYVEPRTQTEKLLADLWNRLLGVDRIGIHDDFFRMGGHSLLATRMISQVRDLFEVELPLLTVFETPRLAGLSAEIEAATSGATHVLPPVQPIAHDDAERNRLSFAQQRLWFLNQLEGPSPTYNIPGAFRLKGHLEIAAVEQALIHIVARHEILRTRFAEEHGQPWAVIDAAAVSPVRLVSLDDLSGESLPGEPLETRIAHYCIHEARQPFDLAQGPLFRAVLLRVAPDDHILLLTMHHIISDGWSINILIREFSALYASYVTNRPAQLPQLPVQYADYVYWQRHQLNEVSLRSQLDYWLHQLDDAPPFLQLPCLLYPFPSPRDRGQSLTFQVDEDLTQRLRALCRETGVTLFMALLSAYALLLSRYSGQQDLVVGSVTANRNRPEVESLIGFFVNTLALRADLSGNPTVADLLARLRRTCLEAFANQDVPFEQLVSELHPERNPGYAPIFQAAFQLLNEPTAELEMPGVSLSMIDQKLMVSKYDLILSLEETGQTLSGMFEFNIDLFETTTIERMTGHLQRLLEGFVEGSSQTIDALSLLSEAERHQLLAEWNDTRTEYPQAQCLHQLFEAQAVQRPEATAVVFEEAHLTYQALNQRANQLANYLLGLGVGPETLVGVCLERSFELVACLLGILKAGGAYVPLDPSYPEARLAYMLADASPLVVITSQGLVERWPSEVNVLVVDTAQTMARLAQALDRRALPAPEETGDETQYEAPATPTEEQLAELWAALLKLERVSVRDHFFDSDGHSLLATRLISHIRRRLGVEISLADLFREPTLRGIADHIDNRLCVSRSQKASNDISTIDDDQEELVL